MTLPEESIRNAEDDMKREYEEEDSKYQWDINDATLPPVSQCHHKAVDVQISVNVLYSQPSESIWSPCGLYSNEYSTT